MAASFRENSVNSSYTPDVETVEGKLLIAAGNTITAPLLERLHNYRRVSGIKEPLLILSESGAPDAVEAVAV